MGEEQISTDVHVRRPRQRAMSVYTPPAHIPTSTENPTEGADRYVRRRAVHRSVTHRATHSVSTASQLEIRRRISQMLDPASLSSEALAQRVVEVLKTPISDRVEYSLQLLKHFIRNIKFEHIKFSEEDVDELCNILGLVTLKPFETLFLQGEPGEEFFIVVSGEAGMYIKQSSKKQRNRRGRTVGNKGQVVNDTAPQNIEEVRSMHGKLIKTAKVKLLLA